MNTDLDFNRILARWQHQSVAELVDVSFQAGTLIGVGELDYDDAVKLIEWKLETCFDYNTNVTPLWMDALERGQDSGLTAEDLINGNAKPRKFDQDPLPVVDPREWQGNAIPDREWFVEGWIPDRTVTNLSGAGGSGKTEIVLQMVVASALRTDWFGKTVAAGPCLYYGAEDEADELHRRMATIVQRAGRNLSDLEGVRLIPMAGLDAVLAEPDRLGKILETDLFSKLNDEADALNPKLIIIDPSADVFGGDEINRAQVRKFVSMLRAVALDHDCAVLLLSHPSLTGLNTGTGTSGSTAWSNSVRSRLYLEVPKGTNGPHPYKRTLKVVKSNYGATGEEIAMRWDKGIYVLDDGADPVVETMVNATVDKLFLELLAVFTTQGQNVGIATGTNYAPAKMAEHPKGKCFPKAQFRAAMQRLFDADKIKIVTEGAPSRQRSRLAVVESTVH
jgi:RecA-family ATPase